MIEVTIHKSSQVPYNCQVSWGCLFSSDRKSFEKLTPDIWSLFFNPRYLQKCDRYEPEILTLDRVFVLYLMPKLEQRSTFNSFRDIGGQTFTFDPIFLKTRNKFFPHIWQLRRGPLAQQRPWISCTSGQRCSSYSRSKILLGPPPRKKIVHIISLTHGNVCEKKKSELTMVKETPPHSAWSESFCGREGTIARRRRGLRGLNTASKRIKHALKCIYNQIYQIWGVGSDDIHTRMLK